MAGSGLALQGPGSAQTEPFVLRLPLPRRTERRACLALWGSRAGAAWHSWLGTWGHTKGWWVGKKGRRDSAHKGSGRPQNVHVLSWSDRSNVTVREQAEKHALGAKVRRSNSFFCLKDGLASGDKRANMRT